MICPAGATESLASNSTVSGAGPDNGSAVKMAPSSTFEMVTTLVKVSMLSSLVPRSRFLTCNWTLNSPLLSPLSV